MLCIGSANSGSVGGVSCASIFCWLLYFRRLQLLQRRLDRLLYVSHIVETYVLFVFGFKTDNSRANVHGNSHNR